MTAIETDEIAMRLPGLDGQAVVVTAGASAPEAAVQRVIHRLHALYNAEVDEGAGVSERERFPLPQGLHSLTAV